MSDLHELQQQFMGHILGQSSSIALTIVSTPVMSAQQRLSIYASAYRLRLKEALTTDYEKLHAYLGDEQFDKLMDDFIESHPSSMFSLRYYSIDLPDWMQTQALYQGYPQLIELAQIEKAFADSFDSLTTDAVEIHHLAALANEDWPLLCLQFQPSMQILKFKSNAFAIWKTLAEEKAPPTPDTMTKEQPWLVWRKQDLITHYRAIDDVELFALDKMQRGATFSDLCESLLAFFDEEETPVKAIQFLQTWIEQEMVAGISILNDKN